VRLSFLAAIRDKRLTVKTPSTETTPKNTAIDKSTCLAVIIYSPSLCCCPHRPNKMPTKRAHNPTEKQPRTQRCERPFWSDLFNLSSIPNTITRIPPSRRKHPNMSEAAFAVRFLTRNVQFHSQCSAMYRRSSSIEGIAGRGPKVTIHGKHCAPAPNIMGLSKLDATGGKTDYITNLLETT